MIIRRRVETHKDLAYLQRATTAKALEKWVPEKQWTEQVRLNQLLPGLFPKNFEVTLRYTHAPIRTKLLGLKRKNTIDDYFKTWQAILPESLYRLRVLKLPHYAHIDAGWEFAAIRAVLRRKIDEESKARAIIRLAGSGLAKHDVGDVRRIPYEVVMAHFAHPDAAAAYDIIQDEVLFPSPSAVRAMQRNEHRIIPDMVDTLAHEGTHAYMNQRYRLVADNDLDQIKLDTVDEAVASAMGDLAAHKLAGVPKPKKSNANWYLRIYGIPLHQEAFRHIYWEVTRNAKNVEDAARIGIAAAKKFGIHVEPRD
ncbi:MAG: hypothetical protein GXN93_04580 [Candidatus Diapherotrites archaeon]|nr:hypothetical protein [Candidatus Diapherotrites archaeon]